jgi:hypothetical protein
MPTLTGQAAIKFLREQAENPTEAYRIESGGDYLGVPTGTLVDPQQSKGGLYGYARNITNPFRTWAEANLMGLSSFIDPTGAYTPSLLTATEAQRLAKNPEMTIAKSGAGIASYLIPGGGAGKTFLETVGKGALSQAASGGLQAFAQSEQGSEIEDTLKGLALGGTIGAGTSAAGYGLSKLIGKLKSGAAGTATKSAAGMEKIGRSSGVWDDGLTTAENIKRIQSLDDLGVLKRNPRKTLDALGDLKPEALAAKGDALSKIPTQSEDDLISMLANTEDTLLKSGKPSSLNSRAWQDVQNSITNTAGDPQALDDLAIAWQDAAYKAGKVGKSTEQQVFAAGAKSIRDSLKAQSPELQGALGELSDVFSTLERSPLTKEVQKTGKQGITSAAAFGVKLPIPVEDISRGIQYGVGRAQQKLAGGMLPSLNAQQIAGLSQGIQQAAPQIGKYGTIATTAATTPQAMTSDEATKALQQTFGIGQEQPGQATGAMTAQDVMAQLRAPSETRAAERQQMYTELMMQGYSPAEAKTITDMMAPEIKTPKLAADQYKALNVIDFATKLENAMGAGTDWNIVGSFGIPIAEQSKAIRDTRRALAEFVGRMESGGAIGEDELKTFRRLVPTVTDTPKDAARKLQDMRGAAMNIVTAGGEMGTEEDLIETLAY